VNQRVGEVVRDEGETVLTRFAVRDQDAFIRWLLSFGRQAELVEPASLRDALDALRADVAALYAEAIP
jgi:predicted DNA-binding transcriptional regulator YafY